MNPHKDSPLRPLSDLSLLAAASIWTTASFAAPATVLFQDDFNGGIPGWTAIQPVGGNYLDGPMIWEYDKVSESFGEQSNLYTDSATFSGSRITSMLINSTVAPAN